MRLDIDLLREALSEIRNCENSLKTTLWKLFSLSSLKCAFFY